jgi:CelD/BcsL family acetyltransferase involved in cellulose biosynthesis
MNATDSRVELGDVVEACGNEVIVAHTVAAVHALIGEWSDLRSREHNLCTPSNEPHRFLAELDNALPRRVPCVVAFRLNGELLALIIGYCSSTSVRCRFGYARVPTPTLRTLVIVHGGLLTNGTRSGEQAILDYLSDLLDAGNIDLVQVCYAPVDLPLTLGLESSLRHRTRVIVSPRQKHWRATLLETGGGSRTKQHSKKTRETLRRKGRRLAGRFDGAITFVVATNQEDVPNFLAQASEVAAFTYHHALDAGICANALWCDILAKAAMVNMLRSYLLVAKGKPIAYIFGTVHTGTFHLEATGYLPEHRDLSPGAVLLEHAIQDLCQRGVHTIDFGFGDADYKRFHGTDNYDEQTLYFYSAHGRHATVSWLMHQALLRITSMAERCIRSTGLLGFTKRVWRGRLQESR